MNQARGSAATACDRVLHGADITRHRRRIILGALELTAAMNEALHAHGDVGTNSEVATLLTLRRNGPQRPREITATTGLTRGGTTNLLDRLERAGVVFRRRTSIDRRGVVVDLTPHGVNTLEAIADTAIETFALATAWLSALREDYAALGLEVGEMWTPTGHGIERLLDLDRLAVLGPIVIPLYAAAFGPDANKPHQLLHMLLLASEPSGTRPSAVCDALRLSSASTSDLLSRADSDGLIVRTPGRPPDRRVVVVAATDRGRAAVRTVIDGSDALIGRTAQVLFPA